jgi:hypothetical protein
MTMYELNPLLELFLEKDADPNQIFVNPDLQITWPIRLKDTAAHALKMSDALLVIVNTDHIREYLEENDPKALEQCLSALGINTRSDPIPQESQ